MKGKGRGGGGWQWLRTFWRYRALLWYHSSVLRSRRALPIQSGLLRDESSGFFLSSLLGSLAGTP